MLAPLLALALAATPKLAVLPVTAGEGIPALTGAAGRPLTWLEPSDHGPLIYGDLGVYRGEPLGTPCDGRL